MENWIVVFYFCCYCFALCFRWFSQARITYVANYCKIHLIAALAVILATDIEYRMLICVQECHFWFGHHSSDWFHSFLCSIVAHAHICIYNWKCIRISINRSHQIPMALTRWFFCVDRFEWNNNVIPFLCVAPIFNRLTDKAVFETQYHFRWFYFCSKVIEVRHFIWDNCTLCID